MCGIHGFVSGKKPNKNADDFITQAFIAGSIRGMDSSGIASIDAVTGSSEWHRLPVSGSMFIGDRVTRNMILSAGAPHTITIGHTRSATSGKIGISEAHPFCITDAERTREILGVHNGTLTNWSRRTDAKNYSVDSEWALASIFTNQFDAFENFYGSYCFVWWDSKDQDTLNIALNNERPMYVAFTTDDGMAYASEPGMLFWLCERNDIKLTGPVRKLMPHYWYKFPVDDLAAFTKVELPKPEKVVVPAPVQRYGPRKTIVQSVHELLDRIAGNTPPAEPVTPAPAPQLSLVPQSPAPVVDTIEQQTARDLSLMHARGTFVPGLLDEKNGILHGVFCQGEMEVDAIIRGAHLLEFTDKTTWDVSCIGAIDTTTTITAICGKPHIKLPQPQPVLESAVLH